MSAPIQVSLISYTEYPVETLYIIWESSRDPAFDQSLTPFELHRRRRGAHPAVWDFKLIELAQKIVASKIPVAENISFTFLLQNIPIALREQIVRHRIGVKAGELLGCDMIPGLQDSTFWSQSMRVLNMGQFAAKGQYFSPPAAEHPSSDDAIVYHAAMRKAEEAYSELIKLGWPEEDARLVLPMAVTHSMTWTLNLAAILHILSKRSCWILQLGFWKPIVLGIAAELAKIDPAFKGLVQPPCMCGKAFKGCQFKLDNEKRLKGEDPLPPCALYALHHKDEAAPILKQGSWEGWQYGPEDQLITDQTKQRNMYAAMRKEYAQLWGIETKDMA